MMQTEFKLYPPQIEKAEVWMKEQNLKAALQQLKDEKYAYHHIEIKDSIDRGEPEPYAGAIGGEYSYKFTPTSVGDIVILTNCLTNESIDLSEYDLW